MDDLKDNPQEVAEDIIKQATRSGFKQSATDRIISILTVCQKLQQEIVELKKLKSKVKELTSSDELCEDEISILQLLSSISEGVTREMIAAKLGLSLVKTEYYLGKMDSQYIQVALFFGGSSIYSLSQKGRAYLVENDLVK